MKNNGNNSLIQKRMWTLNMEEAKGKKEKKNKWNWIALGRWGSELTIKMTMTKNKSAKWWKWNKKDQKKSEDRRRGEGGDGK